MVTVNDGSKGRNGQSRPDKASSKGAEVVVSGVALPVTVYAGQSVVTPGKMDEVHQRPDGTARRTFNQHRDRLIEGEDFFTLDQADEIRSVGLARADGSTPASVTLLTESAYLMLVKSFTDDLAWTVQRQLVASYFRAPAQVLPRTGGNLKGLRSEPSRAERLSILKTYSRHLVKVVGADPGIVQACLARAITAETGVDVVSHFADTLPARTEPLPSLNATELAKAIGGITARALNQRLQALGYQTKNARDEWELSDAGRPFGDLVPFTQHGHSSWQLRWKPDAVDQLRKQVHQPVQPGFALNGGAA